MADYQLNLTDEQRELLVEMLSQQLKVKRVEEHRTDSLSYREIVAHQEQLIEELLSKLGRVAAV